MTRKIPHSGGVRALPITSIHAAIAALFAAAAPSALALTQVTSFGSNPGNLLMYKFVPPNPGTSPRTLVVALHGCNQSASSYQSSGWTQLADKHNFYVVYPQQQMSNNYSRCFNWFEPGDIARGQGEALSIKQMVDKMKTDHNIAADRVFVTGFAAGGFMSVVMAATYPDVFAGAAPIAGGPYKCAVGTTLMNSCMNPGVNKTPAQWGDLLRGGYPGYTGRKPAASIWHGTSDSTIKSSNLTELMEQFTNYHGGDQIPDQTDFNGQFNWYTNGQGMYMVGTWLIANMGHGVPVDPGGGWQQCGNAGTAMPDVNICASFQIGRTFGFIQPWAPTPTPTDPNAGPCYTSSNYTHVSAGRAYNSLGYAKAVGSNQNMGENNVYIFRSLRKTSTNYYVIDLTCPQ